MPMIGYLSNSGSTAPGLITAFRQGLSEAGYVEGQNVAIEYRWAEGRYDRYPALAADLVSRNVDVIVSTGGTPSALAAKSATSTIPIVFLINSSLSEDLCGSVLRLVCLPRDTAPTESKRRSRLKGKESATWLLFMTRVSTVALDG